jgi:hypothetical protein
VIFAAERFGLNFFMHYFAVQFMKRKKAPYSILQKMSAIFMVITLLWLTVSAPVVQACQQKLDNQSQNANSQSPLSGNEEESNPFGGKTEGKTTVSNSFSEEFLHDYHLPSYLLTISSLYHKCENDGTYTAFHGELLVPPPNAA